MKKIPLTILRDTREQRPLDFSPFPDVIEETATLWPGDYTIKGFERSFAVERKSVSDLIGTLKGGYVGKDSIRRYESRFDLELEEFERHYDRVFLVVEPDESDVIRRCGGQPPCDAWTQIANHWYQSAIEPQKVFRFVDSLQATYGLHPFYAASRQDAAAKIVDAARFYVAARRHVIHRGKIAKADEPPF